MSDDARAETRARLLSDEQKVGSDDALEQARIILADSDERTDDPEGTKHRSGQTPD